MRRARLLLWLAAAILAGGERMDAAFAGNSAAAITAAIQAATGEVATASELAADWERPLHLVLVAADRPARRQALAHALGCWHAAEPGAADAVRLTRADLLPDGPLSARIHTSELVGRGDLLAPVRRLLAPWMHPGAGIDLRVEDGTWAAALPPGGHAQLVELLTLLGGAQTGIPALPAEPIPDRGSAADLPAQPWSAAVPAIARAWRISVSLGGDLDPAAMAPALPAGPLAAAIDRLRREDVGAAMIHGALCLGRAAPIDRQHPAERRRLSVLPVPHLAAGPDGVRILAERIDRRLGPPWLALPLRDRPAILVAADAAGIHAALDVLAEADRSGRIR